MTLKEQIASDLGVFLNVDEFAVVGTFNGVSINVLYDEVADDRFNLEIINCKESDVAGITTSSIFIINSVSYTPSNWIARIGMMEIILNVQK